MFRVKSGGLREGIGGGEAGDCSGKRVKRVSRVKGLPRKGVATGGESDPGA